MLHDCAVMLQIAECQIKTKPIHLLFAKGQISRQFQNINTKTLANIIQRRVMQGPVTSENTRPAA